MHTVTVTVVIRLMKWTNKMDLVIGIVTYYTFDQPSISQLLPT